MEPRSPIRHSWAAVIGMLLIAVALVVTATPSEALDEQAQLPTTAATVAVTALPPTATAIPATAVVQRLQAATPEPTAEPTAEAVPAVPRVGIQVGHWKSNELPDELARLRGSTGAFAAGVSEAQVNLDVAERVVKLLEQAGITADLIPATVPPTYQADAFVAIHADGSSSTKSRGYKMTTPWRTSAASQHLLNTLMAEYGPVSTMPQDGAITANMRGYYAFSYRRYTHAIAKTTPAVIVEMGFLTNATDRQIMLNQSDRLAIGIANGIIRYLNERDPNDTAALEPAEFPIQHAKDAAGVPVRVGANDTARVLTTAKPDVRLIPIREQDNWYEVVVASNWRIVGWVNKDLVAPSGDPLPRPPEASDS